MGEYDVDNSTEFQHVTQRCNTFIINKAIKKNILDDSSFKMQHLITK